MLCSFRSQLNWVAGAAVVAAATCTCCFAGDNAWTNAAANMTWDTTSANWTTPTVWNNANFDSAFFNAAGVGTVNVAAPITVRGIRFTTDGYTLVGNVLNEITFSNGAGSFSILSAGEVDVQTGTAKIQAVLEGNIGLQKSGAGRLILAGENDYSGLTTIVNGTLQVGDNLGVAEVLPGNVSIVAGTLEFANGGQTLTFAGIASGGGAFRLNGSNGTLILTSPNTYTGGTTISAGTLQIGDNSGGGAAGPSIVGDVSIANLGKLVFSRSDNLTFAGTISSTSPPGQLVKLGDGVLSLTANNPFAGLTTITSGTLSLGNGGTTGNLSGNIINNATLQLNRSDNPLFGRNISGTGSLVKLGANLFQLTGDLTYAGTTTINGGVLLLTSADLPGAITNNGTLRFAGASLPSTLAGDISGTGDLELSAGSADVTLTGTNTYAGSTTVGVGSTLRIGSNSLTGTIPSDATNNGTIVFNRRNVYTYTGVISGSGAVIKTGISTLTLTGAHSYAGQTTVSNGTLFLSGNGSFAASPRVDVAGVAELDVAGVTGGANFSGGNFALAAGQTLAGTGDINGNVTARLNSTVDPGSHAGTLRFKNNLTFSPGSKLDIELDGNSDTDSDRSRVLVDGILSFSGSAGNLFTVDVANDGGFITGAAGSFTIASANSLPSTGLNSPLSITIGAGGTGSATNASFIRLQASGFTAGDVFALQRVSSSLVLTYTPLPLPGDYNVNGVVDAADYALWRNGGPLANEVDTPGTVNAADYTAWRARFGNTSGSGAGTAGEPPVTTSAVPEPSGSLLTALLLSACFRRR